MIITSSEIGDIWRQSKRPRLAIERDCGGFFLRENFIYKNKKGESTRSTSNKK